MNTPVIHLALVASEYVDLRQYRITAGYYIYGNNPRRAVNGYIRDQPINGMMGLVKGSIQVLRLRAPDRNRSALAAMRPNRAYLAFSLCLEKRIRGGNDYGQGQYNERIHAGS